MDGDVDDLLAEERAGVLLDDLLDELCGFFLLTPDLLGVLRGVFPVVLLELLDGVLALTS